MQTELVMDLSFTHEQQGTYLTLPFDMPPDTEKLTLACRYERSRESAELVEHGTYYVKQELNNLNLGFIAPDGIHVGALNYDKEEISFSETRASPRFIPHPLTAGAWQILVSVGLDASEGLTVTFSLKYTEKHLRLLKGVLHTHTLASDGWLTAEDLGLTVFQTARSRGAFISTNHPFSPNGPFLFDINSLPFDCLEIWNGSMRPMNQEAVGLWQGMLLAGNKVPACGGSDHHRDTPFQSIEGPVTCVDALSAGVNHILAALKAGHSYITYGPYGPILEMTAGGALLGDTVSWPDTNELQIAIGRLSGGDEIPW